MAGRPTDLTPQAQAKIVLAIVGGNDNKVAAAHAGIGESTFYAWLERGRKERARLAASPASATAGWRGVDGRSHS